MPNGLKAQKRSILFQFDNGSFLVVDDELLHPDNFEQAVRKIEATSDLIRRAHLELAQTWAFNELYNWFKGNPPALQVQVYAGV